MRNVALLPLLALAAALATPACHAHDGRRAQTTHDEYHHSTRHVPAELRETLAAFEAAERALDADALIAFLAPDFHMLQDGVRVDYADTVQQMRATLPTLQSFVPRFDDVQVIALSPDLALTSLIFHDRFTTGDGQQVALWGPSTMLWKRHGERWLMVFADSDHYPEDVDDSES